MSPDGGPRATAPATARHPPAAALLWVLRIAGAVLLAAMAWIHLDLWRDGYRTIDVIGPAFLLNAVAGFGLAALLLVTPRPVVGRVAALGALAAAGTLAGLLLSTNGRAVRLHRDDRGRPVVGVVLGGVRRGRPAGRAGRPGLPAARA